MKIYIIENNQSMYDAVDLAFKLSQDVEVINTNLTTFMKNHREVDCIVSPGNSFGQMTGGFDYAISDYLGWEFQEKVQQYIKDNFYGEQVVGSSFIIDTPIDGLRLIHTPTMRLPEIIKDPALVYHCMRSTLICALKNEVKCIVIPVFGGACGQVNPTTAAIMMKKAYDQIKTEKSIERLDW